MKSSSGDPMAHRYLVQRISVAVYTKRKHCCSAREHWTEGRALVVILFGGCYYGEFLVAVYCFY